MRRRRSRSSTALASRFVRSFSSMEATSFSSSSGSPGRRSRTEGTGVSDSTCSRSSARLTSV